MTDPVEKALLTRVDKADPKLLFSFVQQLELLVTAERYKGRVVSCSSLKKR